jgi:hypothetical protein
MRAPLAVAALAAAALACARTPAPPDPAAPPAALGVPLAEAPPALAPAAERADAAIRDLRDRLLARVKAELAAGGPVKAVEVCRTEAPAIAASLAAERGLEVGRTSDRLRNPANAPRPWVRPAVAEGAGKKVAEAGPRVFDLGDRVGVLRPIGVAGACLHCHGAAGKLAPGVAEVLRTAYPDDRAVGYAEGDLRGWFWAESPK